MLQVLTISQSTNHLRKPVSLHVSQVVWVNWGGGGAAKRGQEPFSRIGSKPRLFSIPTIPLNTPTALSANRASLIFSSISSIRTPSAPASPSRIPSTNRPSASGSQNAFPRPSRAETPPLGTSTTTGPFDAQLARRLRVVESQTRPDHNRPEPLRLRGPLLLPANPSVIFVELAHLARVRQDRRQRRTRRHVEQIRVTRCALLRLLPVQSRPIQIPRRLLCGELAHPGFIRPDFRQPFLNVAQGNGLLCENQSSATCRQAQIKYAQVMT